MLRAFCLPWTTHFQSVPSQALSALSLSQGASYAGGARDLLTARALPFSQTPVMPQGIGPLFHHNNPFQECRAAAFPRRCWPYPAVHEGHPTPWLCCHLPFRPWLRHHLLGLWYSILCLFSVGEYCPPRNDMGSLRAQPHSSRSLALPELSVHHLKTCLPPSLTNGRAGLIRGSAGSKGRKALHP